MYMYKSRGTPRGRPRTWTDEQFIHAVENSIHITEVCSRLNIPTIKPEYFNKHIERLGLDTSHFIKGKWRSLKNHKSQFQTIPLEQILIENSNYLNTPQIKAKIFELGLLENRCYECGLLPEWNNKPITLQLHHIDGNRRNNTLKNLTILCPNCHTQTENYGRKNKHSKIYN